MKQKKNYKSKIIKTGKKVKHSKGTQAFMQMHEIVKNNNMELIKTYNQLKYCL